jgi:hypothetical protein
MRAVPLLLSHVSGENLYPEPDFAAGGIWGFAFHRKNRVTHWQDNETWSQVAACRQRRSFETESGGVFRPGSG